MDWTPALLWLAVVASGLYHGVNPGMGWPLAVSAGLMERSSRALVAALWPLTVGHLLAMLVVILPFSLLVALVQWQRQIQIGAMRERIPARFNLDPVRDIQVLCPMNRGGLGARSLNLELQRVLNPPGDGAIQRFGWTFGTGDKVMQVENDYDKEVYNGDLGFVRAVDAEAGEVLVEFDGREIAYGFGELDELVLAYATTIHKAQGSEYPPW